MGEPFLIARKISKKYGGVTALDDVDLAIRKGEVHCLVGENGSGKSTLVKIITGVVNPEPGAEIEIEGKVFHRLTPFEALHRGIYVVHQDLSLFPNLSIAENIGINRYSESDRILVQWGEIKRVANEVIGELGVGLDPYTPVGELPVADQQLVAICRALAGEAKLIILDEPTASLTEKEVERLFDILNGLVNKGIAVLFISHRLEEILEIGQKMTVLRNGKKIGTFERESMNKSRLAFLMTGKELTYAASRTKVKARPVVLKVERLSKKGQFREISFVLHKGEVLGITGPLGAGKTELALTLFGMSPPDSGKIYVEGKLARMKTNKHAMKLGIGYLPENRLIQGIVLKQSVENNIVISSLDRYKNRLGLIDSKRKREAATTAVEEFDIKAPALDAPARTLSGGNQQKVVLSKWVLTKLKILILDGPTVGVDIGAKESIYKLIAGLSEEGVSMILISDEVSEVMQNCARILLMKNGRITDEYYNDEITEEELSGKIRA